MSLIDFFFIILFKSESNFSIIYKDKYSPYFLYSNIYFKLLILIFVLRLFIKLVVILKLQILIRGIKTKLNSSIFS
jgi:hypothetical protein